MPPGPSPPTSRPGQRWTRRGPAPPHRPARSAFAPSHVYRRRRPEQTPLYQVVQHHLETYLAMVEEREADPLLAWTEPEFRRYLTNGILAFGFARARRTDCGQQRLVAFSCKARCVCPSCTNRRMAEVAAHLSDSVPPAVPVRQWVLSVPKRLRPHLMRDADLAGAVLRILLWVTRTEQHDFARGAVPSDTRLGAVSFLHGFGAGLNPHPHVHLAVTDGLFAREDGKEGGPLEFYRAVGLDTERARALTPIVQRRILRLYVRRGLLSESDAEDMVTWRGTGGFSLDGPVRIAAHDRAGLERPLRSAPLSRRPRPERDVVEGGDALRARGCGRRRKWRRAKRGKRIRRARTRVQARDRPRPSPPLGTTPGAPGTDAKRWSRGAPAAMSWLPRADAHPRLADRPRRRPPVPPARHRPRVASSAARARRAPCSPRSWAAFSGSRGSWGCEGFSATGRGDSRGSLVVPGRLGGWAR